MPKLDKFINRNGKKNYFALGIVFSLAAHILLASFLFLMSFFEEKKISEAPLTVELILPPTLPEDEALKEVFKKKAISVPQQQIVQQDETQANNIAPDDTRFLSAKNQKVEKQTVAKNSGEFQNLKSSKSQKMGNPDAAENEKSASQQRGKATLKDLMPTTDAYAMMKKQIEQENAGAKGEWKAKSESGGDVSQTNDYLKDLNQGLETQLNTKEYKYYGYYTRIRKQLSHYWEPKVREKLSVMFKQGRSVASSNDRVTKLLIILNPQGTLVTVQVLSESGVQDLDDAAIEAFRSAAPFPNPPKGIVDPDGTVKIRWDFVLET